MPPRYRPEHAAPVFGGPPRRRRPRRAIRVVVATASWVLALCLVVGAIALVAGATSPGRLHANESSLNDLQIGQGPQARPHHHASLKHRPTGSARHTLPAVPGPTTQRPIRPVTRRWKAFTFHGTSIWYHTLAPLNLIAARKWQLNWRYSCPANEVGGTFALTETGTAEADAISIYQRGPNASGWTFLKPDGGTPKLIVTTSCTWTVTVIGIS